MEDKCVNCCHGGHLHWMGDTGACEIVSCDCKQMVYPKHGDEPRSSPRVAPRQLDPADTDTFVGNCSECGKTPCKCRQVAPGLRDEVTFKNCPACNSTHVTRNGDMVSCTCGFEEYAGKWDSVPRRADIAAQGGQVVDREKTICQHCGYDPSKWTTFGRITVDIENETETFERHTELTTKRSRPTEE